MPSAGPHLRPSKFGQEELTFRFLLPPSPVPEPKQAPAGFWDPPAIFGWSTFFSALAPLALDLFLGAWSRRPAKTYCPSPDGAGQGAAGTDARCQAGRGAQQADTGAGVTSCPWVGASSHAVTPHRIQWNEGVGSRLPLATGLFGTTPCPLVEKPQLPHRLPSSLLPLLCSSRGFCVWGLSCKKIKC